jgi:hypothetical protein
VTRSTDGCDCIGSCQLRLAGAGWGCATHKATRESRGKVAYVRRSNYGRSFDNFVGRTILSGQKNFRFHCHLVGEDEETIASNDGTRYLGSDNISMSKQDDLYQNRATVMAQEAENASAIITNGCHS